MRSVLLHYHLFKNAGTSIDSMLRNSFQEQWEKHDLEDLGGRISPVMMETYIRENEHLCAISSHHAVPPFINSGNDLEVLPVFFLREPIVRAKSAYLFECGTQLGLSQPDRSFSSYIEEKLSNSGVVANFQTSRLSNRDYKSTKACRSLPDDQKLAAAMQLVSTAPYFGLVERYRESVIRLSYYVRSTFPQFCIKFEKKNATQGHLKHTVERQYDNIRKELGNELFDELIIRNRLDQELYSHAVKVFEFEES